jgi:hypothetical protein
MKTLRGLELRPTFEGLIDSGRTYNFEGLQLKSRAALDYRESFYAPGPEEEPVDNDFDAKHEEILGQIHAIAMGLQQDIDRKQARSQRHYRESMPPPASVQEHVTIGPLGAAGESETWAQRQEKRKGQFKATPVPHGHADRQEARQKAERALKMSRARFKEPEEFYIGGDDAPREELQKKYDKRILKNPRKVPGLSRAASSKDNASSAQAVRQGIGDALMQGKRESAAQQARKRERQPDVPSRMRRRKVDEPAGQRARVDIGPIGTAPR